MALSSENQALLEKVIKGEALTAKEIESIVKSGQKDEFESLIPSEENAARIDFLKRSNLIP